MAGKDGSEALTGTKGFDLGIGATPPEMLGNLSQRHFIQMQQGQESAIIGRQM